MHDRDTGETRCVSVSSRGEQGDGFSAFARGASFYPAISGDGRLVAFGSWASNLVVGDLERCAVKHLSNIPTPCADVFLHDVETGVTVRVSVSWRGEEADEESRYPAISASGSAVAFSSEATNLVPDDTNGERDVFVRLLARTCGGGVGEGGIASAPIHDLEGSAGPGGSAVHDVNCGIVVPPGF